MSEKSKLDEQLVAQCFAKKFNKETLHQDMVTLIDAVR